ncbi:turripeptide OL55-like [Sitophilus oryzae]|uniref:Turripeptide OL55-like n=1 Tax=Sitophilus oryzae TaxID=7048 RepID=A0A6J2YYQ0_SITOR|nr:turripeptide OL55-like [Sitophilus oryzae]XP_030768344.1 turripeptide OL55-like [Sitophilus oryzae]
MQNILVLGFFLIVLYNIGSVISFCEDWTICQRIRCAAPPKECPVGQYLIWDDCGCCQRCSEKPKTGPCGICDVDIKCNKTEPVCKENEAMTIDYCGCCKECRKLLCEGEPCSIRKPCYGLCKSGLRCTDGYCRKAL